MKRYFGIAAALMLCLGANAQNNAASSDDFSSIVISPIVADNAAYPPQVADMVQNKLMQAVTKWGLGGICYDPRFVITANLVETTREATSSLPSMIALNLSPTLYIGDLMTGTMFSSLAMPAIKGVGQNETKAYVSAIKNIDLDNQSVANFIENGKYRIIEYYNTQVGFVLTRADALVKSDNYDQAIALLMSVPEVCKDAYQRALKKVEEIYRIKIDYQGAVLLNNAIQVWNADQSWGGAQMAADYLSQINPASSSYNSAIKFSGDIAKRVRELDKREWNFELKKYDDRAKLQRQSIEAIKAIGVAMAKKPITYNTKVYWW